MQFSSDLDHSRRRRIRKDVRSCLNCRQRKVRCKFEPTSSNCTDCLEKGRECVLPFRRAAIAAFDATSNGNHSTGIQRLETGLPPRQENTITTRATSDNESAIHPYHTPASSGLPYGSLVPTESHDLGAVAKSAPLLSLFNRPEPAPKHNNHSHDRRLATKDFDVLQAVKVFVPCLNRLTALLLSSKYSWKVWMHTFPGEMTSRLDGSREGQVSKLCEFIYTSLHSNDCGIVAKVVLCLLLQVQQLPLSAASETQELQQQCVDAADSLLGSDEGLASSIHGIQCMLLQAEYYINRGDLRKVWLVIRRALTFAQLLGLHQPGENPNPQPSPNTQPAQSIWMQLWQMDRGLSMLLGLPCATFETQYPDLHPDMHEERYLFVLGRINGRVIERNQSRGPLPYSATLEIDEALEECKGLMDASWWVLRPPPETLSSDALFAEYSKKFRFFTTRKLVHLPFMLKAYTDPRYEQSRLATLEAAKAVTDIHQVLRDERLAAPKMCNMADFEAFCAAMTILVDLISRPPRRDDENYWQIILDVASALDRVAKTVECSVAAKGARVLQDLHNSLHYHRASSTSGRVCDFEIPYFGKIRIRHAPYDNPNGLQMVSSDTSPPGTLHRPNDGFQSDWTTSVDGWFFPYSAASPAWQDLYGDGMSAMYEPDACDDWIASIVEWPIDNTENHSK